MLKPPATAAIILDTRRPRTDGTYFVKLRIIFNRKAKDFSTIYSLTKEEYAKTEVKKPTGDAKLKRLEFNLIEARANKIIKDLKSFSFEAFTKEYLGKITNDDVFGAYSRKMDDLAEEQRVGTADAYKCASNSLKLFWGDKPLPFLEVTPELLKGYDRWMLDKGRSTTTIGMYMRTLRTLFNDAIAEDGALLPYYPFGKRKYQIPAATSKKKALGMAEIEKILNYEAKDEQGAKAKALWEFSYLSNGANIKDIAKLQYKQISKDRFAFLRSKTERTSRQQQELIHIHLSERHSRILDTWGQTPKHPDAYVFGILRPGMTSGQQMAATRQASKTVNKYMKRIAEAVGIDQPVTTYTARHSYATIMMRAGAPIELISKALGHSNIKTTQVYLGSFDENVQKYYAAQLTNFKGE